MLPSANSAIKGLSFVYFARTRVAAGGMALNTVGAAGAAAGAVNVPTANATTNLANTATVRVGKAEQAEFRSVGAVAANQVTLDAPLNYQHVETEEVAEVTCFDIGDPTEDGATVSIAGQSSDVLTGNRRLALTRLNGFTDLTFSVAIPTTNLFGIAFALGMPLAKVTGTGAGATPFALTTDLSDCGTEQDQAFIAEGVREDGSPIRAELWGVKMDYSNFTLPIRLGAPAVIPMAGFATSGGELATFAAGFTPDTSKRGTKGDVVEALLAVGVFVVDTVLPLATTVAAPTAATAENQKGQNKVKLTSTVNATDGRWLKLSSSDTVEYHMIGGAPAGNVVTLRSNLIRDIPEGVTAVLVKESPFGLPGENGATLSIRGSGEVRRAGNRKLPHGYRAGNVSASLGWTVDDITPTTLAYALGVDQTAYAAAIAAGRLPLLDTNLGVADIEGAYVKARLKNGRTFYVWAMGCSADIASFALRIAQSGDTSAPMTLVPASGLGFMQG